MNVKELVKELAGNTSPKDMLQERGKNEHILSTYNVAGIMLGLSHK